ncbi:unnamed protein product [Trifolium pratense]|uniref:Uncharacterized protein n=1 Tax=Trifolium pratense TaxID=57577 RepID=A0ACB0KS78_TRIPR|nr:unnamed protein product [Trifolium pratense]
MWPFVEEMIAKSDDKTLVVTNIPREIWEETDFLKLFEPFGEVTSAKLAPEKGNLRAKCGFVTFVNKEDAHKAIDELNNSAPRGFNQRVLGVNWAPTPKKSTWIERKDFKETATMFHF